MSEARTLQYLIIQSLFSTRAAATKKRDTLYHSQIALMGQCPKLGRYADSTNIPHMAIFANVASTLYYYYNTFFRFYKLFWRNI